MARLIPKISIDEISLKPERDVARALIEQLSQDCIVYHSYPWLRADRNDKTGKTTLREGEADFVVVIPELGFLILEVKGGTIEYDSENHLWYRLLPNGQSKKIKNPFVQAEKNTHYLEQQIVRHSFPGKRHVPCAYGYAVIFPDCNYSGPMPPGAEDSILFSIDDLQFLSPSIFEALKNFGRKDKPQPLSKQQLDGIVKGLSPSFQLLPVLFRRVAEQEERLVRLTDEQKRALDFLQRHKRVAIEGVAGSGKTLLAIAQAQRFANQNLKTLLVCYNRMLAEWIRSILPEVYDEKIDVYNFHQLCKRYCKDTQVPFIVSEASNNEFWKYESAELFVKAIDKIPHLDRTFMGYDAVVVDEGQDFYPDWWYPLQMISREEEGPFYLFYDPAQNLFTVDNFSIPNLGIPITLPTNCRNTKHIAKMCSQIRGVDIPVRDDAPLGDETKVEVAANSKKRVQLCRKIISDWLGSGKLKPSQIAIQSPGKSSSVRAKKINNVPITESLDVWKAGGGILFTTIKRFKGLEADAIVIIDVPHPDNLTASGQTEFYVACSRAKHLLVVLPVSEGTM